MTRKASTLGIYLSLLLTACGTDPTAVDGAHVAPGSYVGTLPLTTGSLPACTSPQANDDASADAPHRSCCPSSRNVSFRLETVDGRMQANDGPITSANGQLTWTLPMAGFAADGPGFGCEYFKEADVTLGKDGRLTYVVAVRYGCSGSEVDHDASTCSYAGQVLRAAGSPAEASTNTAAGFLILGASVPREEDWTARQAGWL